MKKLSPSVTETPPFSSTAFISGVLSAGGRGDLFFSTGVQDMDLAEDELSDLPSLDTDLDLDLDLFVSFDKDLDFDLLELFLGDLDLLLPDCLKERDFERLADLGEARFLLAGDRERLRIGDRDLDRRREGGVLDLVCLRTLRDLERRLRLDFTMERERDRLLLRAERDRERRDRGGGDLLRLGMD